MAAIVGYREFAGPYTPLPVVAEVPDLDELYAVTDNHRRVRFAFPNGVSVTVDRWSDDCFWIDVYRPPHERTAHPDCDDLALMTLLAAASQEGGIAFVMPVDVGEFGPDFWAEIEGDADLVVCPRR